MVRFLFLICFLINAGNCSNADRIPAIDAKHSGFPIKGISMVAPVKAIDEIALQPLIDVNANSIAIMPYAFCSLENPEVRYNQNGQHWGESFDGVIGSIQSAHNKNISVMVKPHLWIGRGMYTGEFMLATEKEWELWESSYKNYILKFASLADSIKADIFCISTELGASIKARPAFWNSLIDSLRILYHGKLTYAGNWDDYKNFPFWKKLDYIGVDAYFPLSKEKTPSINSLRKGWSKHIEELQKISVMHNRPVLFTEYGYRNIDYACAEPWKENEGNRNDEAQANALQAFYQSFAGKKWFAGGYLWKWYVGEYRHRNEQIDFTPQNKPAEKIIEKWYHD